MFKTLVSTLKLYVLVLLPMLSSTAFAQTDVGSSVIKTKKDQQNQELTAEINFSLKAIGYTTESALNDSSLQQAELGLSLKKSGRFFTNTDVIIGTYSNPNSFYYALPEAYVGYGDRSQSVTFGRKLENLSFLDSAMNFGLIQPHTTNDFINYYPSGLTGLGAHYFSGGAGFDVSYNPIFIPNSCPQVKISDGKANSSSRWASTPPSQFKFGDQNRDIIYAITDYKLSDIIFNQGYMLHGYLGTNKQRPVFSATYGKKPINDIALSRDTFADISTLNGNVILTPVVLYHEVYAADLNLDSESGSIKTSLSFVGDQPINKIAPENQTMQTLSPLSIFSAYLGLNLKNYLDRNLEIYMIVAQISGGEIQDLNSNGQVSSASYATSRTLFKKPLRAGIKGEMASSITADINYTYDMQLKGSLLSTAVKYQATRNLNVNIGFDLLGVEADETNLTQSNFLDQNQANDRVTAGMGYVF